MKTSVLLSDEIEKLNELQPELVVNANQIIGCFHLNASLTKPCSNTKIVCYSANTEVKNDNFFIKDHFQIQVYLSETLYPARSYETKNKILSWKKCIPEEYWHVNLDNSLCLGKENDIKAMQNKYSFAVFFHLLFSEYFYYMSYVKMHLKEPWKTYRHGLFLVLESCYKGGNIQEITAHYSEEIWELAKRINKFKLESQDECPFHANLKHKSKIKNCKIHRKLVRGYNKFWAWHKMCLRERLNS